jgi:hypothetical protein
MYDAALLGRRAAARDRQEAPEATDREAAEVAALLAQAGIDHASSLWFQLLELATQQACDWMERSAEGCAGLTPRAAAILALRSLAADLLAATEDQDEAPWAAAEACLKVCAETEACAAGLPQRRRRWGEGAIAAPPPRRDLLQGSVGCC